MQDFSVIIPARNAALTLEICLQAVFESSHKPQQVMVVNDGSSDATQDIAAYYPCRILNVNIGKGPMRPRFAGAREAKTDICIFVDADVRVKPDTFSKILAHFENPEISAVTGILNCGGGFQDFFSAYKNEYMNYIFKNRPRESGFLYGSLWAVRREDMIYFEPVSEPFGDLVSDSEMGMRLVREGKKILLDHSLEVEHWKKYSFRSLLRNDFMIPLMFSQLLPVYADPRKIAAAGGFSHVRIGQVAASFFAFLGFLALSAGFFAKNYLFWAAGAMF